MCNDSLSLNTRYFDTHSVVGHKWEALIRVMIMGQGAGNHPWKYVKGNACKWCAYIASSPASRMPAFPAFNTLHFHTAVDLATLSYQCTM